MTQMTFAELEYQSKSAKPAAKSSWKRWTC